MKSNPNKLWIVVFVLGWLFDFLFWKHTPGINFAIFALLCVGAAFFMLLTEGVHPHPRTLILLPVFVFFASVTFIRAEPMTRFLATVFTLLSMTLLALSYVGGRWPQYNFGDYVGKGLALIASMIARPITFSADAKKSRDETGERPSKIPFWPILRGIVIALPIVAIFAALLSSADYVFNHRLDDFIKLFNLQNLPEYIFRLIYILIIGYALAGVILHAATESKDEKLVGEDKPILPPFIGFIESTIVLGSVIVLFAAFVIIQFQYFFGGNANIKVEGFTYSEYAVRGFGELVTVAFFALLMLLTLSAVTRRETETQRRVYSGLGVGLVALLLVMLVSAYQRLNLYEAVYGFSRLRTYTHVFLVWLGLLLVATLVLEIMRRERLFTFAMLVASIGFAASLPIVNVDGFIVRHNVGREMPSAAQSQAPTRGDFDPQYFVELSDDSIPVLVYEFKDKSVASDIREQIGSALACVRHMRSERDQDKSWMSFHLATWRADMALASIQKALDAFPVTTTDYPIQVTTPSGANFDCNYYID